MTAKSGVEQEMNISEVAQRIEAATQARANHLKDMQELIQTLCRIHVQLTENTLSSHASERHSRKMRGLMYVLCHVNLQFVQNERALQELRGMRWELELKEKMLRDVHAFDSIMN